MDTYLAVKFKRGDHDAFKRLYELHSSSALRLAGAIMKNNESCKDIVQIAFIRAYEYRANYNPNKEFVFWFNKILINECRRALKRSNNICAMNEYKYSEANQTRRDTYRFEKFELLYDALQAITDEMRIPLLLKYINGYKESEIAVVLSLKASTVKSRLYEGRKKVKEIMLKRGYEEYRHE